MDRMTDEDIAALSVFWDPNALATRPPDPQKMSGISWFAPNAAGVSVTPDTALQVSTVWGCVQAVCNALASSDWNIYERLSDGDYELLPNDTAQNILNVRFNEEMTAKSAKFATVMSAMLWGNGYSEIVRDQVGRLHSIWPLMPDRVEPRRYANGGGIFYRVKNDDGTEIDLPASDVMHIRGPGMNGLVGDNIITNAAHTLALAIATERFAEAYFGNNTQMGVIIEMPGADAMSQPAYDRLKESFTKRHKGPNNAFRFGVLEGGAKLHQLQVQAGQAQLTESRVYQIEEICRWFGVPPHKVAHLVHATLNNIEQLGIEFSRDTLRPWAREIQEEAQYKLFPKRGRPRFMRIDLEWASQGDFKTRMEGYQIGRGMGVFSANDILRMEGRNTIGKEGDVRIVNGAAVKLEDVGKNMVKPATGTPQPERGESSQPNREGEAVALYQWALQITNRIHRRYTNRAQSHAGDAMRDMLTYSASEVKPLLETAVLFNETFDTDKALEALRRPVTHKASCEAAADDFITLFMEKP